MAVACWSTSLLSTTFQLAEAVGRHRKWTKERRNEGSKWLPLPGVPLFVQLKLAAHLLASSRNKEPFRWSLVILVVWLFRERCALSSMYLFVCTVRLYTIRLYCPACTIRTIRTIRLVDRPLQHSSQACSAYKPTFLLLLFPLLYIYLRTLTECAAIKDDDRFTFALLGRAYWISKEIAVRWSGKKMAKRWSYGEMTVQRDGHAKR